MKRRLMIVALFASACTEPTTRPLASIVTSHSSQTSRDEASTFSGDAGTLNAGQSHSCALRKDGSAECWTYNPYGQATAPAAERFSQISAGFATSCGLRFDGTIRCWGTDGSGQTDVPSGQFIQVSTGAYTVCGLRADHTVTCWGGGAAGDLELPPGTYNEVSAGSLHHCGLRTDGTIACHGPSYWGFAPTPEGTFLQVSAGEGNISCAIRTDRSILCWGDNSDGQLGRVPATGTFKQVSAGVWGACALRDDGEVLCWGNRGLDASGITNPPQGPFSFVSMGAFHVCAQRLGGAIVCWGSNDVGQLNIPSDMRNESPVASAGADRTVQLQGARLANVLLDASASTDDGNERPLTYSWSENGAELGTNEQLSVALGIGEHTITLTANDGSLQSTDEVVISVVDPTPPAITSIISGELGNNGWYRSDVAIHFDVFDTESDFHVDCHDAFVNNDTPETPFPCVAMSAGGTAFTTAIVKRDATNPVIGFEGRLSYFVDEDVAVRCNATDAMSGIATNTCANISGPAYTFSLGRNAFTARAVDNAGNESTASGEFTVSVSSQSVCRLVQRWVSDAGTATSLCAKLDAASASAQRGDEESRAGQIGAFQNEVQAQSGKNVPADKAAVLIAFARAL